MKSFKQFFSENIGGTFKDASEWEKSAKARGLVVKSMTHPSGEMTKYQIAKDKEGNNRGHFDHGTKTGHLKEEVEQIDESETKYVVKGKSPFYKQDHYINTHETPKAQLIKKHIKHATRMNLETAKKVAKDWESHPNKYKTEVVPVNEEVELDENIGGLFKDASEWESSAKARGLVVKPATHPSGEATKYQIAKDKEGNNRGHFDHGIKSGKLKEEVELEEKVAWSHKTYADYVAHNKAKGLQVIPKDLWHNLKKNPNQPSMKKEEVELDEELEFTKRVHSKGAEIHDIFHKGKFVGSIGKYFPRNGRPEGYHVLQYTSGREPKGSRGITRHERINSYDDAKKLVAKHFNIQEETELGEAKKPKPGHNASVMAKNISKVLSAVKKEEVEND